MLIRAFWEAGRRGEMVPQAAQAMSWRTVLLDRTSRPPESLLAVTAKEMGVELGNWIGHPDASVFFWAAIAPRFGKATRKCPNSSSLVRKKENISQAALDKFGQLPMNKGRGKAVIEWEIMASLHDATVREVD
jgi:hypothetical protein